MRLAVITSSLPPFPVAGAEHQAWHTARRLAERGHDVVVFARRMLADEPEAERRDGALWIRIAVPPAGGLRFPAHVLRFLDAWRRHGSGVDAVLAFQTVINGVLGALVASPRRPLVTWVRSQSEFDLAGSRKYRMLSPWVFRRSSVILVQGESIARGLGEALAARLGAEAAAALGRRVQVLPNAVTLGPEPDYDGRSGLVCAGRLVPVKGVDVLLTALRAMTDPPPLRLLGDGALRGPLEEAARGLPVTFEGHVPYPDVPSRVGSARILVSPSWSEGFPNVILEGMERGVPVVATRVGSVPDVVRDGVEGILVTPGDAGALGAGIRRFLDDDPFWRATARRARARAVEYGWDRHLDRLEAILGGAGAVPV